MSDWITVVGPAAGKALEEIVKATPGAAVGLLLVALAAKFFSDTAEKNDKKTREAYENSIKMLREEQEAKVVAMQAHLASKDAEIERLVKEKKDITKDRDSLLKMLKEEPKPS